MTFCRRRNAGSQSQRLAVLGKLWIQLRRIGLPVAVKGHILRQAFWSKAFHAVGISLLPWKAVQILRTKAVRALGCGCAGANPALRRSLLSHDATTDPGCFQLLQVLLDFQHFLRKIPTLLEHWTSWCSFNLLTIPETLLRQLLLDAWYQRVAHEVGHSHPVEFSDLLGLPWPPLVDMSSDFQHWTLYE